MSPSNPSSVEGARSGGGTSKSGRAELDYLRNGRSQALDRFSKEYASRILGWAIRLGPPGLDPQEVAREVFAQVLTKLDEQPEKLPAKVWIYRLSRGVILSQSRAQKTGSRRWMPWKKSKQAPPKPSSDDQDNPKRRAIHQVLQTLDLREREALVLVDMEDFSLAEAGLLMGVRSPEVGSLLQKARMSFAREAASRGLEGPSRRPSSRRSRK